VALPGDWIQPCRENQVSRRGAAIDASGSTLAVEVRDASRQPFGCYARFVETRTMDLFIFGWFGDHELR